MPRDRFSSVLEHGVGAPLHLQILGWREQRAVSSIRTLGADICPALPAALGLIFGSPANDLRARELCC